MQSETDHSEPAIDEHEHSLNVYDVTGDKIDGYEALKPTQETEPCVPVQVRAEGQSIDSKESDYALTPWASETVS